MGEQNIEVDKNDNVIGLRPREDFHKGKYIHRASNLILFNSKKEILLQYRAATKKLYPNLITYSVSGMVANETYSECIKREMKEEIGINIPLKKLFVYPFFDKYDKAFRAVFIGKTDKEIYHNKKEIQGIKWIDANKLKKEILESPNKYTPPFVEGMKIFFSKYFDTVKKL